MVEAPVLEGLIQLCNDSKLIKYHSRESPARVTETLKVRYDDNNHEVWKDAEKLDVRNSF